VVDIGQAPAATSRGGRTRQIEQSVTHTLTLPSRADILISPGLFNNLTNLTSHSSM
jgi:hypothetical protein